MPPPKPAEPVPEVNPPIPLPVARPLDPSGLAVVMLTPLNLTTSVLLGPAVTRSSVGVVAPSCPKSSRWAIRASRWPARLSPCVPTWIPSSSSRSTTETTAVLGTRSAIRRWASCTAFQPLGSGRRDETADLDEIERQLGLAEVGADRRDEVGEDLGIGLPRLARAQGVAFALIPEHALDLAAGELDLPQHRAVQAVPALVLLRWVPLLHARPAVAQATRPIGTPVDSTIATANGKPRPAPFFRDLCSPAERAARDCASPECTGSGESTSQCKGSSASLQRPSMPSSMTPGCGGVTSTRSPTPSMFDCPASTQRSPTYR